MKNQTAGVKWEAADVRLAGGLGGHTRQQHQAVDGLVPQSGAEAMHLWSRIGLRCSIVLLPFANMPGKNDLRISSSLQ